MSTLKLGDHRLQKNVHSTIQRCRHPRWISTLSSLGCDRVAVPIGFFLGNGPGHNSASRATSSRSTAQERAAANRNSIILNIGVCFRYKYQYVKLCCLFPLPLSLLPPSLSPSLSPSPSSSLSSPFSLSLSHYATIMSNLSFAKALWSESENKCM